MARPRTVYSSSQFFDFLTASYNQFLCTTSALPILENASLNKNHAYNYVDIYMNRKQFIESERATCRNWTWSWSFVSHERQIVIFGSWDIESDQERAVILREEWEYNSNHKKQPGYTQALEHIRLAHEGYGLYTFNMVFSEHPDNPEVAVIKDFERKLNKRYLRKEGDVWYADFLPNPFPDEIPSAESFVEGAKTQVTVNYYERDPKARQACIQHHGTTCKCCGFNFEKAYGKHGKDFIHVHHIKPLHTVGTGYVLDPINDLIPLCPNCHAMIHRGNKVLLPHEVIEMLAK